MTNIDICRQCNSNGTSCCAVRSENLEKMMIPPVSEAEVERILFFIGNTNRNDVFKTKANSTFYIHQMLNLFPNMEKSIFEAFPENKNHYELKTPNNACALLGINGCVLPKEIRPHFCRIYPFWFFGEDSHIFQDSDCLALQQCDTIPEVLLALGTNPETLKQIYSQIFQDWGLLHPMSRIKRMRSL